MWHCGWCALTRSKTPSGVETNLSSAQAIFRKDTGYPSINLILSLLGLLEPAVLRPLKTAPISPISVAKRWLRLDSSADAASTPCEGTELERHPMLNRPF